MYDGREGQMSLLCGDLSHYVQALTPNITLKPQRVSLIYDVSKLTGYWSKTLGRRERPSTTAEGG
jgi:hypothetical protein